MSVKALFWAIEQTLPPREKLVLIVLANYYNDDEECAWMKQSTLAAKTGLHRTTVLHSLASLEDEHGLVMSEQRRYADGRKATKRYRLNINVAESNTVAGHVAESNTDHVAEANMDHVAERNNKNQQHRTKNIEQKKTPSFSDYQDAWNKHRGTLPKATILNPKRKRAIKALHASHPDALTLFTQAVQAVAAEEWWIQNAYGIDNLLAGNKVISYAEKQQAKTTRQSPKATINF